MKNLSANTTDPVSGKATYTFLDGFFIRLIRDKRDLPFIYLTLQITLTMMPLGIILFLPFVQGWWWVLAAVGFTYMNTFTFKGPFGLMLHCTSHRAFFRKKNNWLNYYLPWVVAPFFGHSPELYYAHHIGMHHPENNLKEDDSSTMPYQRNSIGAFSRYIGLFYLRGTYDLAAYFFRKKRNKLLTATIRGELFFVGMCIALSFISFKATLVVFIIPYIVYRLVAFMGNWAQHAFVCAQQAENPYRNSVTCINTPYNHQCWNDGYHISHHIKPSMHWTEHPKFFKSTIDDYAKHDAIVFDGIHFLHIFIYLMRNRFDLLAKNFVNVGNRYNNDEEVIALLKSRVEKIAFS